jgi:ABC-type lipoprotein export system ATPase subunit
VNIQVSGLNKRYGRGAASVQILRDVSFTIPSGAFVAIMGTSGSGKTTLLNILGGLDRDFTGTVKVGAHDLTACSEAQLAQLRNASFGFVFQQFHLLEHLSALENVALPDSFSRTQHKTPAQERAQALLKRLGLGDKLHTRPAELSGGQKQRVAIARALLQSPAVLLCDEPTGSLDRATGEQLLALFDQLNREDGLTIIMVTHEAHIAQRAQRILRMEDGQLIGDSTSAEVAP